MIYHGNQGTFDDLEKTVKEAIKDLKPHVAEFDAIICQGTSGLVIASPVAIALKKKLLIVRKPKERSHGSQGEILGKGYFEKTHPERFRGRVLFIDDFIGCGETRLRTCGAADDYGMQVVLQYCYQSRDLSTLKAVRQGEMLTFETETHHSGQFVYETYRSGQFVY